MGLEAVGNREKQILFVDGKRLEEGQSIWCRQARGNSAGSSRAGSSRAQITDQPVRIERLDQMVWLERQGGFEGIAAVGPSGSSAREVLKAFAKWDKVVERVGSYARFSSCELPNGWTIAPFSAEIASGQIVLQVHELHNATLARLRQCRSLDDVLAIATPQRLVQLLFGDRGTRALVEPLGDALLCGLAEAEREKRAPTFSNVALAAAAAPVLDPSRLVEILRWSDASLDLVPPNSLTDFGADLCLVLGSFPNLSRRLQLLKSLWDDTRDRRVDEVNRNQLVDRSWNKAASRSKKTNRDANQLVETVLNLNNDAKNALAQASIEVVLQQYLREEAEFVVAATRGRIAKNETASWTDTPDGGVHGQDEVLAALARVRVAYERLVLVFKGFEGLLKRPSSRDGISGMTFRRYERVLNGERLEKLGADIKRFALWGVGTTALDQELLSWEQDTHRFAGLGSHAWLDEGEGYLMLSIPKPPDDLPSGVAQVTQLMRFGAKPPAKVQRWSALLSSVAGPFWSFGSVEISTADWAVERLQGAEVPGTTLLVRLPKDMRELAAWANYMGNCIAAFHGEVIASGEELMLGLFQDDALVYNVSVNAKSRTVDEINSRFNKGEVPPVVRSGVDRLVRAAALDDFGNTATQTDRVVEREALRTYRVQGRNRIASPRLPRSRSAISSETDVMDHVVSLIRNTHDDVWSPVVNLLSGTSEHDRSAEFWHEQILVLSKALFLSPSAPQKELFEAICSQRLSFDLVFHALSRHPPDSLFGSNQQPLGILAGRGTAAPLYRLLFGIRDGEEHVALQLSARIAVEKTLLKGWELCRVQRMLLPVLVELAKSTDPRMASAIRVSEHRVARWSLALIRQAAVDDGAILVPRRSGLWFDLDSDRARLAWRFALAIDEKSIGTLMRSCGVIDTEDDFADASATRIAAGRPPLMIPRNWLRSTP